MKRASQKRATIRREEARILYGKKGWPFEEIAKHMGVRKATVQKWHAQDKQQGINWGKEKKCTNARTFDEHIASVLDDYLVVHQQVMENLKSDREIDVMTKTRMLASLADTFTKTTKAASKISPEIHHIAAAQEVLTKLTQYIIHHHKDKAEYFAEILENFGYQLSQK